MKNQQSIAALENRVKLLEATDADVVELVARALFYADDDKDGYNWEDDHPSQPEADNMIAALENRVKLLEDELKALLKTLEEIKSQLEFKPYR